MPHCTLDIYILSYCACFLQDAHYTSAMPPASVNYVKLLAG